MITLIIVEKNIYKHTFLNFYFISLAGIDDIVFIIHKNEII